MFTVLVEVVGSQDGRDDRDVGVELDAHQPADDGVGHELVTVDAAIDHETRPDHGGVAPAAGQPLGVQRDLERTRHPEGLDLADLEPEPDDLVQERVPASIDDVPVPLGLDEGDPRRRTRGEPLSVVLVDAMHGASRDRRNTLEHVLV